MSRFDDSRLSLVDTTLDGIEPDWTSLINSQRADGDRMVVRNLREIRKIADFYKRIHLRRAVEILRRR